MNFDHEQTHEKEFDAVATLGRLRDQMQTFIDPKTSEGRGFDAELPGSKLLDELAVDTPDKAMALLEATIAANYDPALTPNVRKKSIDRTTWSTALSGLTENELIGEVFLDNPDDNVELWLDRVKAMIAADIMPNEYAARPVHAVGYYDDTSDAKTFWLAQLRGVVIGSVKLASKRSLDIDTERGFHSADDATDYPTPPVPETTSEVDDIPQSTKVGRRGMKELFRIKR